VQTTIASAEFSLFAPTAGAVAAIADAPQIELPTAAKVASVGSNPALRAASQNFMWRNNQLIG
jgi:hypothetical protein